MTLDELLLQKLAEWRLDSGRQTLTVAHPETAWTAAVVGGLPTASAAGCGN